MGEADILRAELQEALDRLAQVLGDAQPTLMLSGDQLCLSFALSASARDAFEALEDVCARAKD